REALTLPLPAAIEPRSELWSYRTTGSIGTCGGKKKTSVGDGFLISKDRSCDGGSLSCLNAAPPENGKNFTRSRVKTAAICLRASPETGRCYSAERAGGSSEVTGSRAGGLIQSLRAVHCIVITRLSEFSGNQDKVSHLKRKCGQPDDPASKVGSDWKGNGVTEETHSDFLTHVLGPETCETATGLPVDFSLSLSNTSHPRFV
ncbi:uncharacterized, partial [Tachysurus ichikawai]